MRRAGRAPTSPTLALERRCRPGALLAGRHPAAIPTARHLCEHAFAMTSQGHPHTIFRRALTTGNPAIALPAAAELGRPLNHADALRLLLILDGHRLYDRAAARWLARLTLDTPSLTLPHQLDLARALNDLGDPDARDDARGAIALTLNDLGLDRVADAAAPGARR